MPDVWTHTGYAQQLHFGAGGLSRSGEIVRGLGLRRVLLVTTAGRAGSPDGERLVARLGRSLGSTFAEATAHVPTTAVQAAVRQAHRDGVDGVVSFGGGSCADLAKAVNFFTEREAGTPATTYADRPALPHVAVPTTYSGAEATPNFGMTDERTRAKAGGGGPTCAPVGVIYDPELTLGTPPRVTAETGLNALAHCVEATYAPACSPEAEAIALAGASRIVNALPIVVDEPHNLAARTLLLEGAALAGRALQNASMGVHHGLAQLLGGRTSIPHGLANALILPHAMRFNADVVPDAMAALGEVLGDRDDPAAAVERLIERVGLPNKLSSVDGVDEADLDVVARLSQSSAAVQQNPRPVGEVDARAILADAW